MMNMRRWSLLFLLGLFLTIEPVLLKQNVSLNAQEVSTVGEHYSQFSTLQIASENPNPETETQEQTETEEGAEASKTQTFEELIANTEKLTGLFTLYRNLEEGKIYLEIKPEQLNRDYLGVTSLSTGIGEGFLVSGFPLNDFMFRLRRINNKIQFIIPNVNFRTRPGDPQQRALERSFSDSILHTLSIVNTNPEGEGVLINLNDLLLNTQDLSGVVGSLPFMLGTAHTLDINNSYLGQAQAFPLNVEIEAVYGFTSAGGDTFFSYLPSIPDSRAFNLSVHYSFSELPTNNGYVPRLADDRLGYFITAYRDFSGQNPRDPFVRYINRWHLEPSDPTAELSTPKEPIVFWLDRDIPHQYRDSIRKGVLTWNKAFEQAGFKNAIEVQQMPNDAQWRPGDIRYNTIRWSNTFKTGIIGIGPSRVNPLTGEILDADIVINANVVDFLQREYRDLYGLNRGDEQQNSPLLVCLNDYRRLTDPSPDEIRLSQLLHNSDFCYGWGAMEQLKFGALAIDLLGNTPPNNETMDKYITQFLIQVVSHEVGHTLGLRHNFHGSTLLQPEELNDTAITRSQGLVSSVMDYTGVNLAPEGVEQGDYFSTVVGPYDHWAIEYGYKPSGAISPRAERRFLETIAQRAAEPELAYATDEDIYGLNDPEVNPFDLSGDVLHYAQDQMDNARQMWERLNKVYPQENERYSDQRQRFDQIFFYYFQQALFLSDYVGGRSFNRDHPDDPNGRLPFESISLAQQREALQALNKYVFAADALKFPPELLNQLAPSRWNHWGQSPDFFALDYQIHDQIFFLQTLVLRSLLSSNRLSDLRDLELKTAPGEALTLPELFDTLTTSIWTEILQSGDTLNISSVRRSLQREYLQILTEIVLRQTWSPEDARTLAWYELRQLNEKIAWILRKQGGKLDTYTQAHLEETRDRILKTLDAPLQSKQTTKPHQD